MIDDNINQLEKTKTNPKYVDDKVGELNLKFIDYFGKLNDFKNEMKNQLDSQGKNFTKFERQIDQLAHKDQIWEIRDEIREFVTKEHLNDVEDKVFPIMDEVVKKIKMFEESV